MPLDKGNSNVCFTKKVRSGSHFPVHAGARAQMQLKRNSKANLQQGNQEGTGRAQGPAGCTEVRAVQRLNRVKQKRLLLSVCEIKAGSACAADHRDRPSP